VSATGAVSIGDIFASLTLEDSFSGRLQAASNKLEEIGKTWNKVGTQLANVGQAMLPLSLAVAAAGTAAVVAAGQFESTLTKISTLAGVSAQDLAKVKDHILDMAPAVGQGPQALADAMMVVSSTVEDTTTALSILDVAARASASGLGDAREVARALTSIINSYGAANITAARAGDILTATVKAGGAEANEMAGTLGRVIPIAAQVGISFEEVGAFMATFTKLGVDASESVTALRGVLSTLLAPTKEAEKALMDVGSSTDGLRRSVRESGLTDTMIKLLESFKGNETAAAAVFGNVRALAGVMGTAGAQAATYRGVLEQVTKSTGLLDKAFDRIKATQVQTWAQLSAEVGVLAIKFGDALAPAFKAALDASKPLLDMAVHLSEEFTKLPQPVQTVAVALGVAAAAAAPLAFAFSSFVKLVGAVSTVLGTATGFFVTETAAVVADTVAVEANTVAKVANATAAGAAGGAAKLFAEGEQQAFLFTGNTVEVLGDLEPALWGAEQALLPLSGAMEATAAAAAATVPEAAAVATGFAAWPIALGAAATALVLGVDGMKSLGSIAQSTGSIVSSFAHDALEAAKSAAVDAGGAMKDFGQLAADTVPGVGLMQEALGGLRGALHDAADGFKEWATQAAGGNWTGIAEAIRGTNPLLASFLDLMTQHAAVTANATAQVMQYQTAQQAATAAAEHEGWVTENNSKQLKVLTDLMAKRAEQAVRLSAAEKDAMDKLNNRDATDAAKLYASALDKVDTVGKMTRATQIKLAESMEEAIKVYQAAGQSIPADMARIAAEARNLSGSVSDSTQAVTDMATANKRLSLDQGGTKMQQGLFDADQWVKDQIKASKDAGTFSSSLLDEIVKHGDLMKKSVLTNLDDITHGVKFTQQEALDGVTRAQNTLTELVSSGANAVDINAARDKLDQARDNFAKFQTGATEQLDHVEKKANQVHDAVESIAQPITMMLGELDKAQFDAAGGLARLQGIEQTYQQLPGRRSGGSGATGLNSGDAQGYVDMLAEQRLYQQLKNYADANKADLAAAAAAAGRPPSWWNMGGTQQQPQSADSVTAAMPGGGSRTTAFAGGGMTNIFNVNGTAEDVARKVGDILMRRTKATRLLPSAG
jgi:TP901 family phage tail tape measure protein